MNEKSLREFLEGLKAPTQQEPSAPAERVSAVYGALVLHIRNCWGSIGYMAEQAGDAATRELARREMERATAMFPEPQEVYDKTRDELVAERVMFPFG